MEFHSTQEIIETFSPYTGLSARLCAWDKQKSYRENFEEMSLVMAPMASVSNAAYRLMARSAGAQLCYTEMVSATGLHYKSEKTWDLIIPDQAEQNIVVQLFGSTPQYFQEAVEKIADRLGDKLVAFDINMACPVPKVTKKGEGSALLENPKLATQIVTACKKATQLPVSVKIRLGRTPDNFVAPDFACAMEQAGVACIGVHGRYASQMYQGTSDTDAISQVVARLKVPVIASGDIMSAQDAYRVMQKTSASACFAARGTYGNPWIFKDMYHLLHNEPCSTPSSSQKLAAFLCNVCLLAQTHVPLTHARSLAGWYLRGIPHASEYRNRAMHLTSCEQYRELVLQIYEDILDGCM